MKINWKATTAPLWKKVLVFVYILPVFMAMEEEKPSIIALIAQAVIAYSVWILSPFLSLPLILWLSISGSLFFLKKL